MKNNKNHDATAVDKRVIMSSWEKFYKKFFDQEVDFSNVIIPEYKHGFNRTIIILEGLLLDHVLEVIKTICSIDIFYVKCLDAIIDFNQRSSFDGNYSILVKNNTESDKELMNYSADRLEGTQTMTLLERLVLELKHYDETGSHLDTEGSTLCNGTRTVLGSIPVVRWFEGVSDEFVAKFYGGRTLEITFHKEDEHYANVCARAVID